jgi:hypothetical protein
MALITRFIILAEWRHVSITAFRWHAARQVLPTEVETLARETASCREERDRKRIKLTVVADKQALEYFR